MRMLKLGLGLAVTLLAAPAAAQDRNERLDETARRAIETLVETMRSMVAKIPMYEAPEILGNGDIIIRRKRPDAAPGAPGGKLPDDQTRT